MPKVRTTMRPHEEIDVSEEELTDLRRDGLLLDDEDQPSTEETRPKAGAPAARQPKPAGE